MSTIVRPALVLFAALTVICGVVYPFATAGIGRLASARSQWQHRRAGGRPSARR
jgi:K+-transporting ATPase c subunit